MRTISTISDTNTKNTTSKRRKGVDTHENLEFDSPCSSSTPSYKVKQAVSMAMLPPHEVRMYSQRPVSESHEAFAPSLSRDKGRPFRRLPECINEIWSLLT